MQNGCVDTTACYNIIGVSLEETNSGVQFDVYPNPTNGLSTVDLGESYSDISVTVINSLGQLISKKQIGQASTFNVSLGGVEGLYFLDIQFGKKRVALIKIIKENQR